jgi:hypothetical protein
LSGGKETMCELIYIFSVQVCLNPWTVQRQAYLRMYLFWGWKGMFLYFHVKKIVPVDMAFSILFLYSTDSQVEVQIRILLKDKWGLLYVTILKIYIS